MASKKERELASKKIEANQKKIDSLWKECASIADEAGVSFDYYSPHSDDGGGRYYPPRPDDWVVIDESEVEKDPNKDHPEHESYHPWNDDTEYDYDWSEGHWISSSSRC
jgi:hypothetical protein